MPLPNFDANENFPPGIHSCTWNEARDTLAFNPRRKELFEGLLRACEILKRAGCKTIYIGGSFATSKEFPGDFDVCWDDNDIELKFLFELDPTLLDFSNKRAAQKAKYGGELFLASTVADAQGQTYLEFFQKDRTGNPKGIVQISL
ncbi:MAG: hypothetical protein AAGA80_02015 [Cyanobacteria bacterium P01_F01_bin.143]